MKEKQIIETSEKIIEIIFKIIETPYVSNKYSRESSIIADVGLDSLQMIAFLLQIEESFDIEIDFEEINISTLETIEQLANFILKLKE